MDSNRADELRESALGYYYQYLLTEAFRQCDVKADKLTEIFQYCVHLAWYYHKAGKTELLEEDLREFNLQFSTTWHTVEFRPRLDLLVKARVLRRESEGFIFRYPYIYYHLKGQYISQNLADTKIRDYVEQCGRHLYVRDHANTILFLVHHTNDDFVINTIVDSLRKSFHEYKPVSFSGDSPTIAKILQHAPKLGYSGQSPEQHRKERNKLQDDLEDRDDGLADVEESSTKLADNEEGSTRLDVAAGARTVITTTEILGQILKNQYSKILRTRKVEIITEIFNGSLRSLRSCWDSLESPDTITSEIQSALKSQMKEGSPEKKQQKLAQMILAIIVEGVTYSIVSKATDSVRSESLKEDVREAVQKNETLAFKLLELNVVLGSAGPIPRSRLKKIYREVKDDLVIARLIQIMVLHRLYMFRTKEQDMQWLASEFNFDLRRTRAISYHIKQ
jgi:hypothetical protein